MSIDYTKLLQKSGKLPIYSDLETLNIYCEYLLNYDSKAINYSNLANMKEFFSRMSEDTFKSNESKMARYLFITYYLEARMDKGIISHNICTKYIMERVSKRYAAIIKREILDSITPNHLPRKEIEFINSMIFCQLNVIFLHDYKKPVMQILEDLNTGKFGHESNDVDNAIMLFQNLVNELTKAQRRSRQENRFNLTDEQHFNAMLMEAIERAHSSAHFWQTGWQGMNKMLNGGFEDARVYNFIGATGGFKSGLLLNLMKQIKLYNKGRPHKDPTKRPTILFLSQENNIWETFLRIWGIFGKTENIKNFKATEIRDILRKGGFCSVQDDLDIDIEFRYYGNMDIGVPDIKGIVQELDNSGKEVIMIIQDYIERLRPPSMQADKRNQLADVSNQLHDLAIELDIPIITASQFNRDGVDIIEQAREKGTTVDIGRKVGSGNVSESFGMLKNFDMNIGIVVEYDSQEQRFYLSFRRLKFRGDDSTSIEYFLQPFRGQNSKIQLMDDIQTEPLYRLTMLDEVSASIPEDINSLTDISRKTYNSLEPMTVDPSENDVELFERQWQSDIARSEADRDTAERDSDGFIVLVRKPKVNNIMDDLASMGIKAHMAS